MPKELSQSERYDKQISDWSGVKTGGQDYPRLTVPTKSVELFGPARRMVSESEAKAISAANAAAPRTKAPLPNYKLPE